jgi:class 3 adenylate cyclase/TolB-like protein
MATPEGFTRRICAVLLADVSGYSALVGRDDAGAARAMHQLHELVHQIIVEAGGQGEPRAGDAIFATFDSVAAAVDAALAIVRRLGREEFAGRRLQVRIGVHFGDVLLREGAGYNEAVGDAINIAARLQALARPGTVCISDGVHRHVHHKLDESFVDLGRHRLKNISDPVHAYLIVPREMAVPRRSSPARLAVLAAGALVLLGAAAAVVIVARQRTATPPAIEAVPAAQPATVGVAPAGVREPVALGVMGFKRLGAAEADWRCDALRDGLNTQLSRLSRVKVYSKEFIDFLISRKGLTEIEAATQLGIRKMLSGSFVATGGTLQIEIHVVDVESGVLEDSYTAAGPEAKFIDLQNQLTLGVISRLDLPASEEEKRTLLAQQNTNVEALKLLLEAEGGVAPPTASPAPAADEPPDGGAWRHWLGAAAAHADDGDAAVREVMERYRQAMETQAIDVLAGLHAEFPAELRAAQERYFSNVRDLHVAIDNLDIVVVGDEAVVSYTRTDDFTDVRTGRPMHVAVRVTKTLRQVDGAWKLVAH